MKSPKYKIRGRTQGYGLRPIAYGVMLACASGAAANPVGPKVAAGAATFQANGKTLNVTNAPGTIINWQAFSIGAGEQTRFLQQSASSAVLNRVVGSDGSSILGALSSNGRVFLVNPHGIVFGAGARIDTAGFIASTLNITDRDFLQGKLKFEGGGIGVLRNEGAIRASGDIMLVGPVIENAGIIRSGGGAVLLAAGKSVTITSPDAQGVKFALQAPEDIALNVGTIEAASAAAMFAGTLVHSGDIRAGVATENGGRVVLLAQKDASIEKGAVVSASGTQGGAITVQSGDTTIVAGRVEAMGDQGRGGTIELLGNRVALIAGARIDASGETGGGTIFVGGDYQGANAAVQNAQRTHVGPDTALRADALTAGDGGTVIVWAEGDTRFHGNISARGGALSGDGGFVETSGKEGLAVSGAYVDTRAPAGRTGTWLLDPRNITISAIGTLSVSAPFALNTGLEELIEPTAIENSPVNVLFQANNDISFDAPISLSTQGLTLTAQAGRSIAVNRSITTKGGNITLTANDPGGVLADRSPDPASITMANDAVINAGTGDVRLRIAADATRPSGNIVVANVTGSNVSISHQGPTPDGAILRASGGSLPSGEPLVSGTNSVHLENKAPGASASIGSPIVPIRINAPRVEAQTSSGTGGIFIESPNAGDLQIGGVPAAIYGGLERGVQTLAGGPIELSVNGRLTQLQGVAGCGGTSGDGGPICAGAGPNSVPGAADTVRLRARDMTLTRPVKGSEVFLLPQVGGTITLGDANGVPASLYLGQTEVNLVDTKVLHIGDGDSGTVFFFANTNIPPNIETLDVRTGANLASGDGDSDVTALGSSVISLTARSFGTGVPQRVRVLPGLTGSVRATSTQGDIFLAQPSGDVLLSRYSFMPLAGQGVELAALAGDISVNTSLTLPGAVRLITSGGNTITFADTISVASASLLLTGNSNFNSGTVVLNTGVALNGPASVSGGTVNFGGAVSATSSLAISSGAVNFNGATTIAGATTLSGGTLGGGANVTIAANGGLNVPSGAPQLTGAVSTPTLNMTGGSLTVATGATLRVTGAGQSTVAGASVNNNGTFELAGIGNLRLNSGATFNNNNLFDIQTDADVQHTTGAAPTFANSGTLRKTASAGTSAIGPDTLRFSNAPTGIIDTQSGTLAFAAGSFASNEGTIDISAGATVTAGALTNAETGTIGGSGKLNVPLLTNNGILRPGAAGSSLGRLEIAGDLTQGAPGRINVEIAGSGPGSSDVIAVSGAASLGGILNVSHFGGFIPPSDSAYAVMTFGSSTGDFATKTFPAGYANFYSAAPAAAGGLTSYVLSLGAVVNAWTGLTGSWQSPANWSLGHIPTSGEDARIDVGGAQVTATITVSAPGQSARSLTSSENITVAGGGELTLGPMPSTVNANLAVSGGTLNAEGPLAANALTLSSGTIDARFGTLPRLDLSGGTLTRTTAGDITVAGAFNVSGGSLGAAPAGGGRLVTEGVTTVTGTIGISRNWLNRGMITGTGTLDLGAGTLFNQGRLGADTPGAIAPGTLAILGNLALDTATIEGRGMVTVSGTTSVTGGTSTIASGLTTDGFTMTSGALNVGGGAVLNLLGAAPSAITGTKLTNFGTVNLAGTADTTLSEGASWDNFGTINLGGASRIVLAGAGPAVLDNKTTGVINDMSTSAMPITTGTTGRLGKTFTNAGTFNKNAGSADLQTLDVPMTNTGTVDLNSGTLVANGFSVNMGTVDIAPGATFSTAGEPFTNAPGGVVKGNGMLLASTFINNGVVAPGDSPGTLTVAGNYVQGPAGILAIEVGGTAAGIDYDVLRVTGSAALDGTLVITTVAGSAIVSSTEYDFLTYASRTGNFAAFTIPGGSTLAVTPGPTSYKVAAPRVDMPPVIPQPADMPPAIPQPADMPPAIPQPADMPPAIPQPADMPQAIPERADMSQAIPELVRVSQRDSIVLTERISNPVQSQNRTEHEKKEQQECR